MRSTTSLVAQLTIIMPTYQGSLGPHPHGDFHPLPANCPLKAGEGSNHQVAVWSTPPPVPPITHTLPPWDATAGAEAVKTTGG
jgi:hypothetical protein